MDKIKLGKRYVGKPGQDGIEIFELGHGGRWGAETGLSKGWETRRAVSPSTVRGQTLTRLLARSTLARDQSIYCRVVTAFGKVLRLSFVTHFISNFTGPDNLASNYYIKR